jgi:hypothetical protein
MLLTGGLSRTAVTAAAGCVRRSQRRRHPIHGVRYLPQGGGIALIFLRIAVIGQKLAHHLDLLVLSGNKAYVQMSLDPVVVVLIVCFKICQFFVLCRFLSFSMPSFRLHRDTYNIYYYHALYSSPCLPTPLKHSKSGRRCPESWRCHCGECPSNRSRCSQRQPNEEPVNRNHLPLCAGFPD